MITKEKIQIYKAFNGDIDGWARIGSYEQKMSMEDKDWFQIESFLQDLELVRSGMASDSYIRAINKSLANNCDSNETIIELKKLLQPHS